MSIDWRTLRRLAEGQVHNGSGFHQILEMSWRELAQAIEQNEKRERTVKSLTRAQASFLLVAPEIEDAPAWWNDRKNRVLHRRSWIALMRRGYADAFGCLTKRGSGLKYHIEQAQKRA